MNLKKILLLSSMALALVAFAVPATASANPTWTHLNNHLEGNEEKTQSFEGLLKFHVSGIGSFGCITTVEITAKAGTTATVDKFIPTTSTCTGTGAFTGCQLTSHTFNTPWTIHTSTNEDGSIGDLVVTNTDAQGVGDINVHNFYNAACGVGTTTSTNFGHILVEPVLENGRIKTLIINEGQSNTAPGGVEPTGELHLDPPSAATTLGLT